MVILIISIIGLVTVSITTSLFNSNIRAGQFLNQQTTIESFYGFMSSRLSVAQRGQIGLSSCRPATGGVPITNPTNAQLDAACNNSTNVTMPTGVPGHQYTECQTVSATCKTIVSPLSVAGDQIIFQSGGLCYRIFYLDEDIKNGSNVIKQGDTLNAAVGSSCDEVWPVRGPNELQDQQSSGDPDYDPVLDTASGSFVLAYGIQSEKPQGATGTVSVPATDPLVPLAYLDSADTQYAVSDSPGRTDAVDAFYIPTGAQNDDPQEILNEIYSLSATAYVSAPGVDDNTNIRIGDRYYQQSFFLNQLCDINGNVITPGSPTGPASGDLTGNYPGPDIKAGAVNSSKIQDGEVKTSDLDNQAVTAGKIGVLPAAQIFQTNAQSIPNNTYTTIQIPDNPANTSFDTDNMTTAANQIIAKTAGYYRIDGLIEFGASTSGSRGIALQKNGGNIALNFQRPSDIFNLGFSQASTLVKLNVGDVITMQAFQNSGAALNTVTGVSSTALSAHFVSGL